MLSFCAHSVVRAGCDVAELATNVWCPARSRFATTPESTSLPVTAGTTETAVPLIANDASLGGVSERRERPTERGPQLGRIGVQHEAGSTISVESVGATCAGVSRRGVACRPSTRHRRGEHRSRPRAARPRRRLVDRRASSDRWRGVPASLAPRPRRGQVPGAVASARSIPMPDFGAISATCVPSKRSPPSTRPLPVWATQASSTASRRPRSNVAPRTGSSSAADRRSTAPLSWSSGLWLRPASRAARTLAARVYVQPERGRVDRRARARRRAAWMGALSSRVGAPGSRRAPPARSSR